MLRNISLTPVLESYLNDQNPEEPKVFQRLRAETATIPKLSHMQISPIQANFMQQLARLMGAKTYLEIGTFTGLSALAMALALPDNGRVITLDYWPDWVGMAGKYWREAKVDHKIEVIIGDAMETLPVYLHERGANNIDMAFIDADKINMAAYYELCLKLVRPKGLIIIDNVLWDGKVADPSQTQKDTKAIRAFNKALLTDDRVTLSMVPVGDGMTLAIKK
jgi:caffeoyl-CoA O-methyltransferase